MGSPYDDSESICERCGGYDCYGTCQGVWPCQDCGKIDCTGLCDLGSPPYSSPAGGGGGGSSGAGSPSK